MFTVNPMHLWRPSMGEMLEEIGKEPNNVRESGVLVSR